MEENENLEVEVEEEEIAEESSEIIEDSEEVVEEIVEEVEEIKVTKNGGVHIVKDGNLQAFLNTGWKRL